MFKILLVLMISMSGCMSASQHSRALHSADERDMTVGTVQQSISKGMSQSAVIEALGSPNIVTRDNNGQESWVYDKIATEASYSSDRGGILGLGGAKGEPGSTLILGGILGSYDKTAGASATTQRTLTVVIKFDATKSVSDFSYHSTKF